MNNNYFQEHKLPKQENPGDVFRLSVLAERDEQYPFEVPHRHAYHTLILLEKGSAVHDIDFTSYKCKSRSVHFVHSRNVHLFLRSEASRGYSFMFMDEFVDRKLIQQLPFGKREPVLHLPAEIFHEVQWLADMVKDEYDRKDDYSMAVLQNTFQALLWKLLRYSKSLPFQSAPSDHELIHRFEALLDQHHLQHWTVNDYASALHISAKHFISQVKSNSGRTPLQMIHDKLISESKKLLHFSTLSIKEISYSMKFSDSSNFSKFFRRETGYTPLEYREGIR